jgi:hypothetical protein
MKRASYRDAVDWIAMNDDNGSADALDAETVASYVSTILIAAIFGMGADRVAADVVRFRRKEQAAERKST